MDICRTLKRYFTPRRIKIKVLLFYTIAFILFVILLDDLLNNDGQQSGGDGVMRTADSLFNRDRFFGHPKDVRIPGSDDNILNVQVNVEFDVPTLNMERLASDNAYKEWAKAALFEDKSDVTVPNSPDPFLVKECECLTIETCRCCLQLNLENIRYTHLTCVYVTYVKGIRVIQLVLKLNIKKS
jgi:hypothetical protein